MSSSSSDPELAFLDRTLRIPWFDRKRMKRLRVTVVGAGNTGSQLLLQISGLGLREIKIIDRDIVELSNLQRHMVYSEADIGEPKATAAADFLKSRLGYLSTRVEGIAADVRFAELPESDYIFSCVDNVSARRVLLRHCLEKRIPLMDTGLEFYESQAGHVLLVDRETFPDGACLNCYMDLSREIATGGCIAAGITYSGGVVASVAAGMFVQHIHGRLKRNFFFTDLNSCTAEFMFLKRRESCRMCCKEKR